MDEAPKDKAVTQERWHVTEALIVKSTVERWAVRAARTESAYTTPNAAHAATKPHEADTNERATKCPNNDEASTDGVSETDRASNATRRQQ